VYHQLASQPSSLARSPKFDMANGALRDLENVVKCTRKTQNWHNQNRLYAR
jgi:hypothetical protein